MKDNSIAFIVPSLVIVSNRNSCYGRKMCPLKLTRKVNKMETKETTLTHEKIVEALKLVAENETKLKQQETELKTQIKQMNMGFRKVQKSVTGNLPKVSSMVNFGISNGITTNAKLTADSGVSKTTISRFDWIGATLAKVTITKTSEKLAIKTLNELSKGNLTKGDLETIQDIEGWKLLLQKPVMAKVKKLSCEDVKNAILDAQFSNAELDEIIATAKVQKTKTAQ